MSVGCCVNVLRADGWLPDFGTDAILLLAVVSYLSKLHSLQANVIAVYEFGKELEGQVNKLQYLAVLFSDCFRLCFMMRYQFIVAGKCCCHS